MQTSVKEAAQQSQLVRMSLVGGVIGPLLFVVVFLIEGATRPNYDPWHHYVSSLSRGDLGWIQIASFVICGLLVFGFAVGLRHVLQPGKGSILGAILIGLVGLGLIGLGVFVADPLLGYPPGDVSTSRFSGKFHMISNLVTFPSMILACFVLARIHPSDAAWRWWPFYAIFTGVLTGVFFILPNMVSFPEPETPIGLMQRLCIIPGFVWISALAFFHLRKNSAGHQGA